MVTKNTHDATRIARHENNVTKKNAPNDNNQNNGNICAETDAVANVSIKSYRGVAAVVINKRR